MHIPNVERQFDDWPVGVSPEDKPLLVAAATRLLEQRPCVLWIIVEYLAGHPTTAHVFKNAALQDWRYAVADRAARGVERVEQGYWIAPPVKPLKVQR
jgi:hypothetical protein